ncbi:CAP domain-containing protein [Streptomyces sp. NPDC059567]|uniref:CAP domain-containing protein n=1 Tax=Streptomyces sp. NPDC059567 TaxID=3346867 RepID=UPI0036C6C026
MGRHRRSGAAPAAEDYAAGSDRRHRGERRRKRGMRTGLLGASAAVAVGAVAVASGLLPGGDTLTVGSAGSGEQQTTQSRQTPELTTQGGSSATPTSQSPSKATGTGTGTGKATGKANGKASSSPSATPSPKPSKTTASPAPKKPAPQPSKTTAKPKPKPAPTTKKPVVRTPAPAPTPSAPSRAAAAEAEVVRLVNVERAKVGCTPVRSDGALAALAGAFSQDMAQRGFFDHTDPDGDTPWDRAGQAGVTGMGGENIARGQVDAAAVMASWMNSDGHRANILNCDYKTLGVGVYFADGGPWWTQDFGF